MTKNFKAFLKIDEVKYKDSLAYRIVFRNPERTLTDEEVNAKHERIAKAAASKLNVRIRM